MALKFDELIKATHIFNALNTREQENFLMKFGVPFSEIKMASGSTRTKLLFRILNSKDADNAFRTLIGVHELDTC